MDKKAKISLPIKSILVVVITQIVIYLLNLIQINMGLDPHNSILVSFLVVIVPTAFIVVLFKLKPHHLLLSIPVWCITLFLFFVPGRHLTVQVPADTDIAFTSFADSLIYRFFAIIEIAALELLITLLVIFIKKIVIFCSKLDRNDVLKHTILPLLIWVTVILYMNIVNILIAPLIGHLCSQLDNTYSEVISVIGLATLVLHTVFQIVIVCIFTTKATRKFSLSAKSLLIIIPVTYLLFALYAPHGWYMLVYTDSWSFIFNKHPAMPYWYASIFITLQYGFVMLCALCATRAKMYPNNGKENKEPSDLISEILYCSWKRENILKENLSVARYNRYFDRMTRCAKILKDEKRLDTLLPYLKNDNISVRFDIATLLFPHYKNECTEVLSQIAKMTEEKGLPKHLASLPENADKLVNNDFFGEVNAYETSF